MMNWHPEVKELLDNQNYQALVNYYEQLVENEPDEISNYWYLGLAYLLDKREQEGSLTWFIALNEVKTEIKEKLKYLIDVLENEAVKWEQIGEYYQAWIIRNAIRQLNPRYLYNLLSLLSLNVELKRYRIQYLIDSRIIELLKTQVEPSLSINFLVNILNKVLKIPNKYHVSLAESVLFYTKGDIQVLNCIKKLADKILLDDICIDYGIDLLKLCLKFKTDRIFLINLYSTYRSIGSYSEALSAIEALRNLDSSTLDKLNSINLLLSCHLHFGKWDEAITIEHELLKLYNKLLQEKPITNNKCLYTIFVNLMYLLYLRDDLKNNRYFFNEVSDLFYLGNKKKEVLIYPQSKKIRPLKIGYIGHTFRNHSVGLLSRWLISHHNSKDFVTYIYNLYGSAYEDHITEKFFKTKTNFFFSGDKNCDETINQIKQDRIDILIDVDSVTSSLTALVLIEKPAPIQVTWLGLDASGLPSIDYYIADPYVLLDDAQQYYREKIWYLPSTYLAVDGFEVSYPTLKREDLGITSKDIIFMNLQNPSKLNPQILKAQLQIVKLLSNAYLCIKIRKNEELLKKLVTEIAESENVSSEKLRFLKFDRKVETHRANLAIADVILDTYPYNGSTTTLEALWMEIPVVTRVGEQFASRNSYTYMMNAGITEGIAWSDEEYIEWGIKLGTDENLRKEISWKLKQSKKTSPLWNGKQFAREMENAYRQMWEIYVKENS